MVGFMPRSMRVDRLLSEHDIGQDSAAGRQEFERQMERRRLVAIDEEGHSSATPASWPALLGCGAKRPFRSIGLQRGRRLARPKGPSPCSIIWLRAKANAKPQDPSNHTTSSNSNRRFDPQDDPHDWGERRPEEI
jgi:hypothetical protein